MNQGASFEDVVDRLRPRTVPLGYLFHTWKPGIIMSILYRLWHGRECCMCNSTSKRPIQYELECCVGLKI